MNFQNMIGWFALMLGVGCIGGLLVAGVALLTTGKSTGPGGGLLFLAMASFLSPVGMAAIVSGAIGVVWSGEAMDQGHKQRCWFALAAGLPAAIVGGMYGVGL